MCRECPLLRRNKTREHYVDHYIYKDRFGCLCYKDFRSVELYYNNIWMALWGCFLILCLIMHKIFFFKTTLNTVFFFPKLHAENLTEIRRAISKLLSSCLFCFETFLLVCWEVTFVFIFFCTLVLSHFYVIWKFNTRLFLQLTKRDFLRKISVHI